MLIIFLRKWAEEYGSGKECDSREVAGLEVSVDTVLRTVLDWVRAVSVSKRLRQNQTPVSDHVYPMWRLTEPGPSAR